MKSELRVLATRCHTASCCPTIMLSESGGEIVIIGDAVHKLLSSPAVKERSGENETAVVIPRDLFIEALEALKR